MTLRVWRRVRKETDSKLDLFRFSRLICVYLNNSALEISRTCWAILTNAKIVLRRYGVRKFANFKPGLSRFANNIYVNAVDSVIVVLDIIIIFIISGSSRFDFIVIIKIDIVIIINISIIITITITGAIIIFITITIIIKILRWEFGLCLSSSFYFSEFSLPSSNRQV